MTYNLFEKRDYLALEKELLLRGQLLEAFAEWAMVELPVCLLGSVGRWLLTLYLYSQVPPTRNIAHKAK
jgi:hypothetical protein